MSFPKVPSLQHLVRNCYDDPEIVKRELIKVVKGTPPFSYDPIFRAIRELLILRTPYEQVLDGVQRRTKIASVKENYSSILPLIRDYFANLKPDFVQNVDTRYYALGRGLLVPFRPPLIYGLNGSLYLPWFSLWKENPLEDRQLRLFVALIKEMLSEDPGLEKAKFTIVDLSAPGKHLPRTLKVLDIKDVEDIEKHERERMLHAFVEGFLKARVELKDYKRPKKKQPISEPNQDQIDLFKDQE